MPTIELPPDIVDKALVVVVDEQRSAIAVWKGRGRVDLHDAGGTWHETLHPYPRHEEGTWSRDDVLRYATGALSSASPPAPALPCLGSSVNIEADALRSARLVRATALGYALWNGDDAIEVHAADGTHLRSFRVPTSDLPTISQLMLDLLEVGEVIARQHERLTPST
jgi:hypothetical protein